MQIKTLEDILHWTTEHHQRLSDSLAHSTERKEQGRASLLLGYLAKHEGALAQLIRLLEQTANTKALNMLCYEYLDKHPILQHPHHDEDFSESSADSIVALVVQDHEQIIELYRYLYWRSDTVPAQDLLKQLLALEEHQAMKITQKGNRA